MRAERTVASVGITVGAEGMPRTFPPLSGSRRPADLAENRGVITTTLVSGVIAVAAAEFDTARLFEESLELFRRAGTRLA